MGDEDIITTVTMSDRSLTPTVSCPSHNTEALSELAPPPFQPHRSQFLTYTLPPPRNTLHLLIASETG